MIFARLLRQDCSIASPLGVAARCAALCAKLSGGSCSVSVLNATRVDRMQKPKKWQLTHDGPKTEKKKLTAAPDQLQNWSAQVGSLEYKNTWFSEEGGRNTLRSTTCSNGVSKTYLLFIIKQTRKPWSLKCDNTRNADFLLPKLASLNDHQRNVQIPNHGSCRPADVHTFHDASFGVHL